MKISFFFFFFGNAGKYQQLFLDLCKKSNFLLFDKYTALDLEKRSDQCDKNIFYFIFNDINAEKYQGFSRSWRRLWIEVIGKNELTNAFVRYVSDLTAKGCWVFENNALGGITDCYLGRTNAMVLLSTKKGMCGDDSAMGQEI